MKENSSFRDPSGFIFYHDNKIYRAVTHLYKEEYDLLIESGLYDLLIKKKYLIPHQEIKDPHLVEGSNVYKILQPESVEMISYPYEWSFSQLKDAALLTLKIQELALTHGMSLKDASAYNIQFHKGRPVFIDTLSFEKYIENKPWNAYGQFCRHFLAPLALMSHTDIHLNNLLKNYIDGIPLDLTRKLLPFKTRFHVGLYMHLYLHAQIQNKYQGSKVKVSENNHKLSKNSMLGIISSLRQSITAQKWVPKGTEWGDYQEGDIHTAEYKRRKAEIIDKFITQAEPHSILDMGANTGYFSRIAAKKGANVISCDIDPACVEKNYLTTKQNKEDNLLPLFFDLFNPSPAIGWANEERTTLQKRCKTDLVMALALIHHLCISGNIPLEKVASYFRQFAECLIIEFVPKTDPKVQVLLINREDIFPDYTQEKFEAIFSNHYQIVGFEKAGEDERIIYLLKRKNND